MKCFVRTLLYIFWVWGVLFVPVLVQAQEEEGSRNEKKVGPGGRPLRLDYPGTAESKKAQMGSILDERGSDGIEVTKPITSFSAAVLSIRREISDSKDDVFRSKSRYLLLKTLDSYENSIVFHTRVVGNAGDTFYKANARVSLPGLGKNLPIGEDVFTGAAPGENVEVSVGFDYRGYHDVFRYVEGYRASLVRSCLVKPEGPGHYLLIVEVAFSDLGGPNVVCSIQDLKEVEYSAQSTTVVQQDKRSSLTRLELHLGSYYPVSRGVRNRYFSSSTGLMLRGVLSVEVLRIGVGASARVGDFDWTSGVGVMNFSGEGESRFLGGEARFGIEFIETQNLFLEGYVFSSFTQTKTSFFGGSDQVEDVEVGRFFGYGVQFEGAMELGRNIYASIVPSVSLAPIFVLEESRGILLNPAASVEVGVVWVM